MALVRRTAVEGRQATPAPTTPTALTVPRQPSAADIDEAAGAAAAPPEEIAAAPDRPPRLWAVLLGLAVVAGGAAAAYALHETYPVATIPPLGAATTLLAVVLFALVVERLLEPMTRFLPGRGARNQYEQQVADLANRLPNASLGSVAAAKAKVAQRRAEKAVLSWGLATAIATVLAAAAGFHLLRVLVTGEAAGDPAGAGAAWQTVPVWVDALVTGLIVGSASKPVHDLVSRLQQQNAQRRDPTES
jgi:hypothetical protein